MANNKYNWQTLEWKKYILAVVIVLLIEIFAWNHSFWLTSEYVPIKINEIYTETGNLLELGSDYVIEDNSSLEMRNINQDIKNVYLNIQTYKDAAKNVLTIKLNIADEGNKSYYGLNNKVISPLLGKCNYISVYPYGNLKALKLTFPYEKGTTISIEDITLNKPVPMFFSVWRVLLMFVLYLLIRAFFFKPYQTYYQPDSKKQKCAAVLIFVLCTAVIIPLAIEGKAPYGNFSLNKYTDLTHSLANGMVNIDVTMDERMLTAQNPYDRSERRELGVDGFQWDYAYFDGKIYVYFGIAPVILTYLPYYLFTGEDLPHLAPYMIFLIGLIAGSFMLIDALIGRYCKKMPLKLYYLLQVTFMLGIGTLIFAKRICIYNMVIMAAVDFTVWGLYLWLSSFDKTENYRKWKIFAGSLCMAFVAGCRPQLVLASFLALPIFASQGKSMLKDFKEKKNIGRHILLLLTFCIPYIAVAAFLMWYNAARFGSPFDFGASYNLTSNDMTKRGFHFARLVPGLWSFLFQPPHINIEFPYIRVVPFNTYYQGVTIQEATIGGIFATNIILLPCFFFYHYRTELKKQKTLLFTGICLASAVLITCADVQMSGILTRYMADFAILFYLAAYMIIFISIEGYSGKENVSAYRTTKTMRYRLIALLCFVTILYLVLSVFCLYEVSENYDGYNAVWFYRMKELWGVFDI